MPWFSRFCFMLHVPCFRYHANALLNFIAIFPSIAYYFSYDRRHDSLAT